MYKLNATLIQMTLRRLISGRDEKFHTILADQRLKAADLITLQTLNRTKLTAIDQLPVSLFRVHYNTMNVGNSGIEDGMYERICIRNAMISEAISFVERNQISPIFAVGFDVEGYEKFRLQPFSKRLMICWKGEFGLGPRSKLLTLELKPGDSEALLRDSLRIIMGDYRWFSTNRPRSIGRVSDWSFSGTPPETAINRLLCDGVTPKLVMAHFGKPDLVVSIHRKLRREQLVQPKSAGRIGTHTAAINRLPHHSLLFMLIYLMLARSPESGINGFAFSRALHEYRQICGHIEIEEPAMLSASECWLLAAGYRSTEVVIDECRSCREITVYDRNNPGSCVWCKGSKAGRARSLPIRVPA